MQYITFESAVACPVRRSCYITVPDRVHAFLTRTLAQTPGGEETLIPVCGDLAGFHYRGSVQFNTDFGGWFLPLEPGWLVGAHVAEGDGIKLTCGYDPEPRDANMPWELAQSLGQHYADGKWASLPAESRRAFCDWVSAAEGSERMQRADSAAIKILYGQKL